ncbi:MAG: gamma-glutamyl-gamma-aminobutyrate hydrolase family protein [Clostridiales bacterium]|nr:gamma-glutamyl-gamma-aminobutyrate hydrolase family protein [Clostridiales bacterium]
MKPIIGVTPLFDVEKDSIWMVPGYLKGIEAAGGLPVILPLTENLDDISQLFHKCGGFLFTGGHDISPSLYNEEASPNFGDALPERDSMEKQLLSLCLEYDKPAFGICRGIQLFNAILGGSLYQDLPTEHSSEISHKMKPPYDLSAHSVSLVKDTPLQKYLGRDTLNVNSYHHQAIKTLAPCLKPQAFSPDGLTEAVYLPENKFIHAVQWHPEFMYKTDPIQQKIFNFFIESI